MCARRSRSAESLGHVGDTTAELRVVTSENGGIATPGDVTLKALGLTVRSYERSESGGARAN